MYLGLDLGTSSLKALIVDGAQAVVAEASAPLTVQRPRDGWSEQDPVSWIAAAEAVLAELPATAKAAVRAIGLSGQMHGATLLDARDRPLRPCILWNDTRADLEAQRMSQDAAFKARTGNHVFPGFTAPKLAWLRTHEPDVFAATRRVLLPKDYLRLWLTGEAVTDMSDASGTSWLDIGARSWAEELVTQTGLTLDHMPRVMEGSAPTGTLRPALADRFGLPPVPVAGGGGDNAASAVALGVQSKGDGFVSLGTSGVVFLADDRFAPPPQKGVHTYCHALPERWHKMGVMLACGDAIKWAARLFGKTPEAFVAAAGSMQAPGRTTFLPYLGGERTPHASAAIRGAFTGLEHATDAGAIARAVLEGVSYALNDCLETIRGDIAPLDRLTVVGGGARSDAWLDILANALGVPLHVPDRAELGAALGAGRLAMLADGAGQDALAPPPSVRTVEPTENMTAAHAEGYARFREAAALVAALD
ncbi:MAG: xylulokinase [Shimia sp.]